MLLQRHSDTIDVEPLLATPITKNCPLVMLNAFTDTRDECRVLPLAWIRTLAKLVFNLVQPTRTDTFVFVRL